MLEVFDLFGEDEPGVLLDTPTPTPAYRLTDPERRAVMLALADRWRTRVMWQGWREKCRRNPRVMFRIAHHATRQVIASATDAVPYRETFTIACRILSGQLPIDVRGLHSHGNPDLRRAVPTQPPEILKYSRGASGYPFLCPAAARGFAFSAAKCARYSASASAKRSIALSAISAGNSH